ncbi:serine hydrolase domain-containing protein [Streptomyces sp. NPDC057900]|uniref:serine hydrolase domain-containing protein n=1 Tax=Streptomyces sp. NPDC057900 TaxID=3346274 RepID=UPI0036F11DF3
MPEDGAAVDGRAAAGWEGVVEAFARGQATDPGAAQLTVHHRGRVVVDAWTTGRPDGGRTHGPDSVGVLMSVTKGLVAVCVHLLSERGQLDPDAPVARYWPEYAVRGKEGTTVADLLTHSAGLPSFTASPADAATVDLLDREECAARLAASRPLWRPGTAALYHSLTFGHLAGEIVRRITGSTVGEFFAAEIAAPLGLSLWIGLPPDEEHRFVPQHSPAPSRTDDAITALLAALGLSRDEPLALALMASTTELTRFTDALGTRAGRAAEVPAAGGIGDARSLSRLYAAVIGHVDGVRLLSPLTVERACAPRTDRLPPPAPLVRPADADPSRFGLGFELPRRGLPMLGEGSFGHAGAGGRLGMAHPRSGLAVGYTCTEMSWTGTGPDPRWVPWTRAIHEAAGTARGG